MPWLKDKIILPSPLRCMEIEDVNGEIEFLMSTHKIGCAEKSTERTRVQAINLYWSYRMRFYSMTFLGDHTTLEVSCKAWPFVEKIQFLFKKMDNFLS
ncbi:unnamed protein product [Macrosiphum euphorbiae]|uniref:Uncharacterized protein n=1 Tax=Macrosiphum euphorbiae TaxID=13131 RepID=A0AAV0XJ18_9HEMI|nr:unnamed protein product [Macrosiphum euphorbiae]